MGKISKKVLESDIADLSRRTSNVSSKLFELEDKIQKRESHDENVKISIAVIVSVAIGIVVLYIGHFVILANVVCVGKAYSMGVIIMMFVFVAILLMFYLIVYFLIED